MTNKKSEAISRNAFENCSTDHFNRIFTSEIRASENFPEKSPCQSVNGAGRDEEGRNRSGDEKSPVRIAQMRPGSRNYDGTPAITGSIKIRGFANCCETETDRENSCQVRTMAEKKKPFPV